MEGRSLPRGKTIASNGIRAFGTQLLCEQVLGRALRRQSYDLNEERLTASFNTDSILELSPDLVGPSIAQNAGIIGESVNMTLEHLGDMRPSTLVFHLHSEDENEGVTKNSRRAVRSGSMGATRTTGYAGVRAFGPPATDIRADQNSV